MRLAIGRVGKAHGLSGWVTVTPTTDEPELRFARGAVLFCDEDSDRSLTVAGANLGGARLQVRFDGCSDRTAAEALRGTWLFAEVDPAELPADPDELYDHQLIGLQARVGTDVVGEVVEVVHLPSQDLLSVRTDGADVLVPFVHAIVPEVDLAGGWLRIDPPPGLFEGADDAS